MRLSDDQVTTEEVKTWQGLHLLHFQGSSCSQKVRILLAEKGIPWTSHPVDLLRNAHATPWYLGINPRGVVPVLVHDGVVHVESNDILEYLDRRFPSSVEPFFPQTEAEQRIVKRSLDLEDSLHMDLRAITMGFLAPQRLARKSPDTLQAYEQAGAHDEKRDKEIAWWKEFARQGVSAEQAKASFRAFEAAFQELDKRLEASPWLIGERISVLEVAWFISVHRLVSAGYPIERHAQLNRHYRKLLARPAFAKESDPGAAARLAFSLYGAYRRLSGTTLLRVVE